MNTNERSGMTRRGLGKLLTVLIWVYGLAALASLGLAIVGVWGLFGTEPDALASIFAIVFAMPWFLLVDTASADNPEFWGFALLIAGMALNLGILVGLRWWLRRGGGAQ